MRDDRHKWTPAGADALPLEIRGCRVSSVLPMRQTLMSGPGVLRTFKGALAGWPDIVSQDSYALRLRRDRLLVVNGPQAREGWDAAAHQAVSDVSDGYTVFELSGPSALHLLQHGAELSLEVPSDSVVRQIFGLSAMLYRYDAPDQFRLHISRGNAEAFLHHIKALEG